MAGRVLTAAVFGLAVGTLWAQSAPPNDGWATAVAVSDGINPAPPAGADDQIYTNQGADDSAGFSSGFRDVFFSYTANAAGACGFSTCPAPGYATPSASGLFVEVYPATGGAPLASNAGACGATAAATATLAAGTSYVVRVGGVGPTGEGTFRLMVAPAVAAADGCAAAPVIAAGTGFAFLLDGVVGATPTPFTPGLSSCENFGFSTTPFGPGLPDVWVAFTPAVSGTLFLAHPAAPFGATVGGPPWTDVRYALRAGCSAPGACAGGAYTFATSPVVTAGQTYAIRIAVGGASPPPSIVAGRVLPPSAPECAAPAPATLGTQSFNLAANPSVDAGQYRDTWFDFVAPTTGAVRATAAVETAAAPVAVPPGIGAGWTATAGVVSIEVYSGGCPPAPRVVGPVFGAVRFATTAGAAYRIRVRASASPSATPCLGSLLLEAVPQPSGDECSTAIPCGVGATSADAAGATLSESPNGACAVPTAAFGAPAVDLWFAFVAPAAAGYRVGASHRGVAVYETCGGTQVGCSPQAAAAAYSPFAFAAAAGQSFLIRVFRTAAVEGGSAPFAVDVAAVAPNDECAGSVALVDGENPPGGAYDFASATVSPFPLACLGSAGGPVPVPASNPTADVFFVYVPTSSGRKAIQSVGVPFAAVSPPSLFLSVGAACDGTAPLVCDAAGRVEFDAVAGATYRLRAAAGASGSAFKLLVGTAATTASDYPAGVSPSASLFAGSAPAPHLDAYGPSGPSQFVLMLGSPVAAPILLDAVLPGALPSGATLWVEPSTAWFAGPYPAYGAFGVGAPPVVDPALWGATFAAQGLFFGADEYGTPLTLLTNGVVFSLGI